MDLIIKIIIAIVCVWLIIQFLAPLLPAPFGMIVIIIVVLAAVVWLLKVSGLWF